MEPTRIRQHAAIPVVFGAGAVALGGVLGAVATPVARWLVDLLQRTPIPVHQLIEVLAGLTLPWSLPIGLVLGVVAGAALAASIVQDGLTLTVDSDGLEYQHKGWEGWLDHADVASVHRDGRYAVVLGHDGGVLARLDADGVSTQRLRAALVQHGYRYLEVDPFEADYRRWQDGRPGLDSAEHRLVRRWRATGKDAEARTEVEVDLRQAGLAIRERDGRIQVRRTAGSRHGTHRRPAAS
ncbi:YqeB family protein [Ruania albidiflava]|uniref:YqeB family protein n=1 Tax=Ruania albidiflava TaxID=366586 RepID=UPI0003B3D78F|nr:hypothetical protein [Ruania albidiflava]